MVLPPEIYLIKGLGWIQSIVMISKSRKDAVHLRSSHVTASTTGSVKALAIFRVAMFFWALSVGVAQMMEKGMRVLSFYTVWNWWLLTLFFFLASLASIRALWRARREGTAAAQDRPADALEQAAVIAFAVEAPTCLIVDLMTWTVLVPMLKATSDPDKLGHWMRIFHSFESYNQHGFNAAMMLAELALGRIPLTFSLSGWVALWASLFGVWSTIFFVRTGRYIYPFLNAHKPYAWVGYVGLYAVMLVVYSAVIGLVRARDRLLPEQRQPAAVPKAKAA